MTGETMTKQEVSKPPEFQDAYPGADELMKSIMTDWGSDDEPAPAEAPEESNEEQPEPEAIEAGEPDAEDVESPDTPAVDTAEVEKARRAAKLAGLPASVIEKASEEELVEWYSSHAKNEADVKRTFREAAELRREIEELKATKGAEPAVPTASEDQELVELLTEEFGEERGKKLAELISARDAQSQQRVATLEAALEQRLAKTVWGEVSQKLGIEDKDGAYDRVTEQARSLAKVQGPWTELEGDARAQALFTAAARLVMPDLPSDSELKRRAAISAARKNGAATSAPQRNAPPKKLTYDEILDAKIEAIRKGETDTAKLRAIGR